MEKIKLRRKTKDEQREWDMRVVTDYVHGIPVRDIMERHGIKSVQTVYNAIDRVNKLLEADQKGTKNVTKEKNSS